MEDRMSEARNKRRIRGRGRLGRDDGVCDTEVVGMLVGNPFSERRGEAGAE
jgi:hypothetical protein